MLAKASPVGRVLNSFLADAQKTPGLVVSVPSVNQLPELAFRLVNSLSKASERSPNTHWFRLAMKKMQLLLKEFNKNDDFTGRRPANGVIDTESCQQFHRLWSALSFLFCLEDTDGRFPSSVIIAQPRSPTEDSNDGDDVELTEVTVVADEDAFGHGFSIGGTLIVYLLDQKAHFQLLDYSYHVLNVYNHDINNPSSASTPAEVDEQTHAAAQNFIMNASLQRQLHNELFTLFSSTYVPIATKHTAGYKSIVFHPPKDD